MAVYLILNIEVTDADTYGDYVKQAPATVEQYGGDSTANASCSSASGYVKRIL